MLYIIIGCLLIALMRMFQFMGRVEIKMKQHSAHEPLAILFFAYVLFLFVYLREHLVGKSASMLMLFVMFLPVGFVVPMIFRRYRTLTMNVLFAMVCAIGICLIQTVVTGSSFWGKIVLIIMGDVVGYLLYAFASECSMTLGNGFLVARKKKKRFAITFELEITVITLLLMVMIGGGAGKILGDSRQNQADGLPIAEGVDRYKDIYYAQEENYARYEEYSKIHPDMSLEEIVWRVEANLDREFYDEAYVKYADENTNEPLLINKFNCVSEAFKPKELVEIENGYEATPETVAAYHLMTADMEGLGLKIMVHSAYRTIQYQYTLYNSYLQGDDKANVDSYSARPGYSEHHTGRALDISHTLSLSDFAGSDEAEWIYANAYKYGFIVRYTSENQDITGYISEPWHIVYVGTDISFQMHQENISSLEEYVVKYVDNQPS